MYLMYLDESGSTGLDLDNKSQPFFVLAGISITDDKWHEVNDFFEQEKIKIYPEFANLEIHTNELFNSNPKSPFYKNPWKDNLNIVEKLGDLISSLDIKLSYTLVHKKDYKKHFGNNIIVDPYLYSFAVIYKNFDGYLQKNNSYGIIFCDELKNMETSLEILYPKLKSENKNIIEKTFYLNSKKNNFIQIADICSFYINKANCIFSNTATMDIYKKQHCIRMYTKVSQIVGDTTKSLFLDNIDNYFK